MKIGSEDRRKLTAACILMAATLFMTARWLRGVASEDPDASLQAVVSSKPDAAQRGKLVDPRLRFTELDITESEPYEGSGRNIFRDQGRNRFRKVSSSSTPAPKPPASVDPATPEFTLRFFGIATVLDSTRKACVSKDGEVFIGGVGDIVDRRYRILRVGSSSVDVEDLLENTARTLTLQ